MSKLKEDKQHLGDRINLASSSFCSLLTDILSEVNHIAGIKADLLEIISDISSSDFGYAPTTSDGERASFGTKITASISDLKKPHLNAIDNAHDFITLNANCLRDVLSTANTETGEFYSLFLN